MTTFTTTGPPNVRVRIGHGRVAVDASDRADVTVDVQPADPSSAHDREHAERTRVEQRGDWIIVEAPSDPLRGRRRLDARLAVPSGSRVELVVASAHVACTGELGATDITTASGDAALDRVRSLHVRTSSGDVVCKEVTGDASAASASGDTVVRRIGNSGEFTSASGDIIVDAVGGEMRARTASGDVVVGALAASGDVRTASGDVRLGSVRTGTVAADTASGDIEVGIAAGVAAWLDVHSRSGRVSSELDDAARPSEGSNTVSVAARSASGDIRIVRAAATTDLDGGAS